MASDFSVPTFAHLQRLLLVHGHLNYHRLANFLQYSLGKNAIVVFVYGGWHQLFCGFSAAAAIDPLYSMFYPIVFTRYLSSNGSQTKISCLLSVQSILFGIMDRDETADRLLAKPELYRRGRLDMVLSIIIVSIILTRTYMLICGIISR